MIQFFDSVVSFLSRYLDDLPQKPGDGLQVYLGDVLVQGLDEQVVVRFGEDHTGEQVRNDALEDMCMYKYEMML